jgi:hypothetical protein
MLANFQTQSEYAGKFSDQFSDQIFRRMIGTVFIGLERSMMDFFGKNHHLGIIFPASPNNVRLTSKLYRMHKNKSSSRF